jgi:hypothetical protein
MDASDKRTGFFSTWFSNSNKNNHKNSTRTRHEKAQDIKPQTSIRKEEKATSRPQDGQKFGPPKPPEYPPPTRQDLIELRLLPPKIGLLITVPQNWYIGEFPVTVDQVVPDSTGELAGIQVGDEIVAIFGVAVSLLSLQCVFAILTELVKPGDVLELTIKRQSVSTELLINVTVGTQSPDYCAAQISCFRHLISKAERTKTKQDIIQKMQHFNGPLPLPHNLDSGFSDDYIPRHAF